MKAPRLRGLRPLVEQFFRASPGRLDTLWVVLVALVARLAIVAWAHGRFPPADDGRFYDVVAGRIAEGLGYTWLWPDGAVTYAAHYPVGYPGLIGGLYAAFGSNPTVAMIFNAVVGSLGAGAVHRIAAAMGIRGPALIAGSIAALHPGFVFYTAALMTEGVTAALLAILGALAVEGRNLRGAKLLWLLGSLGVLAGLLALIRPQTVVLAPVFGAFAAACSFRWRLGGAAIVFSMALIVCLPWTLRNCARLEHCVFVSANGGWNLLIGSAEKATGRWVPIDVLGVPEECRNVFGEAEKDKCFGRAGLRNIVRDPLRFVKLAPTKLAATFDWSGAPGHYLNASNPARFEVRHKISLGVVQTLIDRLVLLFALLAIGRAVGPRRRARAIVALVGMGWLFHEHAWVAYMLAILGAGLLGVRQALERPGVALGVSVLAATALTHAVFFGDGRYGLVAGLLLVALAAEAFHPQSQKLWANLLRRSSGSGASPSAPDGPPFAGRKGF